MKFDILNRWTGAVQFTAEIDCEESASRSFKIGLAVKWARKNAADLRGADLGGADLRGADLRDADLGGADLRDADLGGANLRDADLRRANLGDANLGGADLGGADLGGANLGDANLGGADLGGADLGGADLRDADLGGANLRDADLRRANLGGANLGGANLLCLGNMAEVRTLQFGKWMVAYTADTLQIGCQRHAIEKWRKWDTPAGRKWIAGMDNAAAAWADRNLALVLAIIDANPATPTGHEAGKDA